MTIMDPDNHSRRNNNSSIGKAIAHYRQKAGYTRQQLANIAQVSIVDVNNLEENNRTTGLMTLVKICRTLNTTVQELMLEAGRITMPQDYLARSRTD